MLTLMKIYELTATISIMIMSIALLISKKTNLNQEKSSTYECGFDPHKKARQPFSLHFFLITLLFLIFDAEIALILPLIPSINSYPSTWSVILTLFFMTLTLGTYYEWYQGILNWK